MSKFTESNEKITEGVTEGMQKIEEGVVEGYKKIEDGVVGGFKKIEDKFTEKFLNEDGTLKTGKVGDAVVAGSNIGKIVSAGFKGTKKAVKEELAALKADAATADENVMFADAENTSTEEVETSPADFAN